MEDEPYAWLDADSAVGLVLRGQGFDGGLDGLETAIEGA